VSEIARFGSGSACRSVAGGFVKWHAPKPDANPQESISTQLYGSGYWSEMNVLALVLHDRKKDSSSTDGMRLSAETSELLPHRVQIVEARRLAQLESALASKDFNELGRIIMQDSNCFHAICLDTQPPLFYLNDKSREIIRLVNEFNRLKGDRIRVAYSFDAGPNAFLFLLDDDLNEFLSLIRHVYFGAVGQDDFLADKLMTKMSSEQKAQLVAAKCDLTRFEASFKNAEPGLIKYIIHSKVGDDPKVVVGNDLSESLLDLNGNPKGERV
jgi:diphosphomevalonate decarboxylase